MSLGIICSHNFTGGFDLGGQEMSVGNACPPSVVCEKTPMKILAREPCPPFTTKDGSEFRELLAHQNSSIRNQSLAETILRKGQGTTAKGRMRLSKEEIRVGLIDSIAIPPGVPHKTSCVGGEDRVFLCSRIPIYRPDDLVFLE